MDLQLQQGESQDAYVARMAAEVMNLRKLNTVSAASGASTAATFGAPNGGTGVIGAPRMTSTYVDTSNAATHERAARLHAVGHLSREAPYTAFDLSSRRKETLLRLPSFSPDRGVSKSHEFMQSWNDFLDCIKGMKIEPYLHKSTEPYIQLFEPLGQAALPAFKRAHQSWVEANDLLYQILNSACKDQDVDLVQGFRDCITDLEGMPHHAGIQAAKALFKAHMLSDTLDRARQEKLKFESMVLQRRETIEQLVSRLTRQATTLKILGYPRSDQDMLHQLLHATKHVNMYRTAQAQINMQIDLGHPMPMHAVVKVLKGTESRFNLSNFIAHGDAGYTHKSTSGAATTPAGSQANLADATHSDTTLDAKQAMAFTGQTPRSQSGVRTLKQRPTGQQVGSPDYTGCNVPGCGSKDHLARDCPSRPRQPLSASFCVNCESDHDACDDCANMDHSLYLAEICQRTASHAKARLMAHNIQQVRESIKKDPAIQLRDLRVDSAGDDRLPRTQVRHQKPPKGISPTKGTQMSSASRATASLAQNAGISSARPPLSAHACQSCTHDAAACEECLTMGSAAYMAELNCRDAHLQALYVDADDYIGVQGVDDQNTGFDEPMSSQTAHALTLANYGLGYDASM